MAVARGDHGCYDRRFTCRGWWWHVVGSLQYVVPIPRMDTWWMCDLLVCLHLSERFFQAGQERYREERNFISQGKPRDYKNMITTIVCIVAFVGLCGAFYLAYQYDQRIWNDGKCECGGNWMPSQFVDPPFVYSCDKCGCVLSTGFDLSQSMMGL